MDEINQKIKIAKREGKPIATIERLASKLKRS